MSERFLREIGERYTSFMGELEGLCDELGRGVPTVVAVSKTKPAEMILAARDCGLRDFGENYAQELKTKAELVPDVTWHFIGHLQRRNVKLVIPHASYIHSVDSMRLLDRLKHFDYSGVLFLQYNLSGEESKQGVPTVNELVDLKGHATSLSLRVEGLMVMGSTRWDSPTLIEKFRFAKRVAEELFGEGYSLSAGMSGDWREAVTAGATHLRIGSAIFGPRD